MTWKSRVKLDLTWYDHRLNYTNLKVDIDKNLISAEEESKLWVPQLLFEDAARLTFTSQDSEAHICKHNLHVRVE